MRRLGIRLTYVGHASVMMELDGARILTDPLLRPRVAHLRRRSGARIPAVGSPDVVLISHGHHDHLDRGSLTKLRRGTRILVPAALAGMVRRIGDFHVTGVQPGDAIAVGESMIEVTHAEHDGRRPPFGPRAAAVGYRIRGSPSVFFAGDTDLFQGMSAIGDDGVDVALLPVWGWGARLGAGHMDPRSAAEALRLLRPVVAVPIHWGTLAPVGLGSGKPGHSDEPAAAFVRFAAELAPDVKVIIIPPGATADL